MSFDISFSKNIAGRAIEARYSGEASILAITGPSGVGKTTLLNCIAGLTQPDSGHISIGGQLLFDAESRVEIPPHQRGCGYVFQDSRLFPHRSVRQNLIYGMEREGSRALMPFDEAVELLALSHLLDRKPANLSGGETKRVAIGRAILSSPQFLLLDEPLASLDAKRSELILSAIEHLRDEAHLPMIYVSHDPAEVSRLTDVVIRLD